jgi:peptidoglycan-N-acetylglucosamine deacetylase
MKRGPAILPLAPAHLAALGAFQLAALCAAFDPGLAALPLVLFLAACFAAPFFPRSRFYLPVTWRGARSGRAVALTFDDGPDPATTPALLDLLAKLDVRAAFFVTGTRAGAHPDLVRMIIRRGHEIGNHSFHHSPLLMFRSARVIRQEISRTQHVLTMLGITPLAFRPPVGITGPRLWRPLLEAGLFCVNFSRRARDAGNRRVTGLAKKIARRARPGDIVLLHDVSPRRGFDVAAWLGEVEELVRSLTHRGFGIVPLSALIGRPVMQAAAPSTPAGLFYGSIAASYDDERRKHAAWKKEMELAATNLLPRLAPDAEVLELGAGTGLFTVPLARRCRRVTAIELSPAMADILTRTAREQAVVVSCRIGDIEALEPEGAYDAICSFSALEYVADPAALFARLSPHLKPGGLLYVTTARRSLFRFFTQVGNALRQGLWLRARTARSMEKALESAGFTHVQITSHLKKWGSFGGMLMEIVAVKPGKVPGFFS